MITTEFNQPGAKACSICGLLGGEHYMLCPRSVDYYSPERERSGRRMELRTRALRDRRRLSRCCGDSSHRFRSRSRPARGSPAPVLRLSGA